MDNSVSISSILSDIASRNEQIASTKSEVAGNAAQAATVTDSAIQAASAAADAKTRSVIGEETNKAVAQQSAIDIIQGIGANKDYLIQLGNQQTAEFNAAMAARDKIAAKESVGFFDNPVEWVVNQFTVEQDYADYNAHVDKNNALESRQVQLNQLATTVSFRSC